MLNKNQKHGTLALGPSKQLGATKMAIMLLVGTENQRRNKILASMIASSIFAYFSEALRNC